jgi:hypothetical protein
MADATRQAVRTPVIGRHTIITLVPTGIGGVAVRIAEVKPVVPSPANDRDLKIVRPGAEEVLPSSEPKDSVPGEGLGWVE